MTKSEISSKSSARTREEIERRNPELLSDFKLAGGKEAVSYLRGSCERFDREKSMWESPDIWPYHPDELQD